jgi:hypothetical protein
VEEAEGGEGGLEDGVRRSAHQVFSQESNGGEEGVALSEEGAA